MRDLITLKHLFKFMKFTPFPLITSIFEQSKMCGKQHYNLREADVIFIVVISIVGLRLYFTDNSTLVLFFFDLFDNSLEQSLTERMNIFQGSSSNTMTTFFNDNEVRVLEFFANALDLLYNDVKNRLGDPNRRYIITGYSLGAGLASLFALKMAFDDQVGV